MLHFDPDGVEAEQGGNLDKGGVVSLDGEPEQCSFLGFS